MLRKLSDEQKRSVVAQVLDHYAGGIELKQLAQSLGVHEKTLYRLGVKLDRPGWYMAQEVRLSIELEDMRADSSQSDRNSWDYRDQRLQANKRRLIERE
jgi:hypothetical protein